MLGTPEVIRQVDRNGLLERVNHLQALWNSGIAGYVAVVTAKDVHATPRVISDYRRDIVFAIEHLQQNPDASIDAVFAREPIPVATLHQHAAGHRTVANSDAFPLIEIPASPR